MFYSKSTGGFYSPEIHAKMPSDVVEITAEQHQELINAQSQGKVIVGDDNGYPIAVTPTVTPEQIEAQLKAQAQAFLNATDYKDLPSYKPKEGEDLAAVIAKRDEARSFLRGEIETWSAE